MSSNLDQYISIFNNVIKTNEYSNIDSDKLFKMRDEKTLEYLLNCKPDDNGWIYSEIASHYRHDNIDKFLEYSKKGADLNNPRALCNLAECCILTNFGEIDLKKRFELTIKSANLNYHTAYNNLGLFYEYGDGVTEDINKAIECYTKSVELGNINGMMNLARIYEKYDQDKATELYIKAIKLNITKLQFIDDYSIRSKIIECLVTEIKRKDEANKELTTFKNFDINSIVHKKVSEFII